MPYRRRTKRLGGDLQADINQDRKKSRLRQPFEQVREPAKEPGCSDEECCRQRVASPSPHCLVRRMADVGRGLDDPAASSRRYGRQRLRQKNAPCIVLVARSRGALCAIDAADDRRHGKRQDDGYLGHGRRQDLPPPGPVPGMKRQPRRITGIGQTRLRHCGGNYAHFSEGEIEANAHQYGGERTRDLAGKRPARDQRHENDGQRHEANHRHSGDVEQQRHEGDQRQGNGRQRPEQSGPRHPAPDRVAKGSTERLEQADQDQHQGPDVPGEIRGGRMIPVQALPFLEGGQEHQQGHGERAGRIEAQGHGGDVRSDRPAGQTKCQDGVDQVAQQNAQSGAGNHAGEDKAGGEALGIGSG